MRKQSSNQEESQPRNYYKDIKAALKESKTAPQATPGLTADALPGSQVTPATKTGIQRISWRLVADICILLAIAGLLWYLAAGPGRPGLEQKLSSLKASQPTAVQPPVKSPTPTQTLPITPSVTASPTRTVTPTSTRRYTYTPTFTSTHLPPSLTPSITPTPTPACWQAVDISLDDVGKTLCVRGTVTELITQSNSFLVIFGHAKGAFYWVSYDMAWDQAKLRTCYQLVSKIIQIGNSPIQIFDYSNIPEVCP
ncbi:MAG: hypothetical protein ACM3H7_08910 [Acidobacteriaceae bacterium]